MDIISFLVTISFILIVLILRNPIIETLRTTDIGKALLKNKKPLLIVSILLFTIFILSIFVTSIPVGTSGVVTDGFNIGKSYNQGIHFKNPFDEIDIVPWYTQNIDLVVQANSNDSIPVIIYTKLSYNIKQSQASTVRVNYPDYKSIIEQTVRSTTSDYSSKYSSLDLAGHEKMTFTNEIRETLGTTLSSISINLVVFNVESITLPESYQIAITNEKSANKDKQATILKAEANAEAIGIINTQLANVSSFYLQWQYIQALTDPNTNVQWILPHNNFYFPFTND